MRAQRCIFVLVLALAGCGAASGSPVVKTTGAEVSSISRYTTYTFALAEHAPEGYARRMPPRPEVLEQVQRDVDAELQRRGYQPSPNGELVVRISTGSRIVEDQPTGGAAAVGAPAMEETEGALVIDIFERDSGRQLFHGFAHDVIRGEKVQNAQIAKAVSKILEKVPAR